MTIQAFAIPFFVLAIFIEVAADKFRGTKYYRFNDAVSSLSGGVLNTTSNIFMTVIPYAAFAFILEHVSPVRIPAEWFDFSPALLWFFYLPLMFAGVPLSVFLVVAAISQLYQIYPHTRHIGKLGPLEWFLNTPSHHRVHHGRNDVYVDRNYGGVLIIWDRLFGTFQEELDEEPVVLLEDSDHRKYDPPMNRSTMLYSLFQFSLCVGSVAPIMLFHKSMPGVVLGGLCLFVWTTLFTIGAMNEARGYAIKAEMLRLFAAAIALPVVYFMHASLLHPAMLAAGAGYVLGSAGALAAKTRLAKSSRPSPRSVLTERHGSAEAA